LAGEKYTVLNFTDTSEACCFLSRQQAPFMHEYSLSCSKKHTSGRGF